MLRPPGLIPGHWQHRLWDPGTTAGRHGAGAAVVHGATAEGQQPVVGHGGDVEDVVLRETQGWDWSLDSGWFGMEDMEEQKRKTREKQ